MESNVSNQHRESLHPRHTDLASELIALLHAQGCVLGCAESCTGGLLSAAITDISGSSTVMVLGKVTYANATKIYELNVPARLLESHGAVSAEVAKAMALAIQAQAASQSKQPALGLATTGIAGPETSEHKPVGLVYIALALPESFEDNLREPLDNVMVKQLYLSGDRHSIRAQTTQIILADAVESLRLSKNSPKI